jgi:N-acetylglucosaminyldiphosphoundecaprenol N-acetyl-beta-D-mannosaminyltransferase
VEKQSYLNNSLSILDYKVFNGQITTIHLTEKTLINTINQYSYCIAEKDPNFKKALQNSDILLPDGIAITFVSRIINGKKIKKIAGADIHKYLLEELNKTNGSCFYLGSSQATLDKIKNRISIEYPKIKIQTYSPPFKASFSEDENKKMIEAVNSFKPNVLFVGMTAPKQEKWSFENKDGLDTNIICSIGAVFDFYAGTVKRPNKIWIKLGLEWFIRLIKEPKRMSKRYLYYGPIYFYYVFKFILKK